MWERIVMCVVRYRSHDLSIRNIKLRLKGRLKPRLPVTCFSDAWLEAKEPAQQEASPPVASTQVLKPAANTPKTADPGLREELLEKARKRKGGKEPTQLDLFNELMLKGAEKAGAIPDYGKPRIVPKGAKPEIVIKDDKIMFNGRLLQFGKPLMNGKRFSCQKPVAIPTK